jgi:hypothetical protein
MDLKKYFDDIKGIGILATSDKEGKVDAAVYSRPHFMKDRNLAFIMADRLTHNNLQSNPYTVYLFVEQGPGYNGQRFFLRKTAEEQDTERLYKLRRRKSLTTKNEKNLFFWSFLN